MTFVIEQLHRAGTQPVTDHTNFAPRVVEQGEVFIIRGGLQAIDCFEPLLERSLAAFSDLGADRVSQIRSQGFSRLHAIVTPAELLQISQKLYDIIPPMGPTLLARIGRQLLGLSDPFFVEDLPNARVIYPLDVTAPAQAEMQAFEAVRGPGKVTVHGPHHDSWFEHPLNVINIWAAISPVIKGNGMSVYPEVWGQRLPYDESGQIDRGQYFGAASNFDLAPGDIAVFAGEHLHGSEINTSATTRYVISGRITLEEPRFFARKAYRYERSDLVEDDIGRVPMQITKPGPNPIRRQLGRIRRAIFGAPRQHYYGHPETREIPPLDDTSGDFPPALQIEEDQQQFFFHATGFPNDGVKPLNRRYCVVKSGTWYYVLARHCPHQHADLAAGYLEQGRLYCPWHNLAIDFRSGESACESLPNLSAEPLEQHGERVFIPAGLMV